MASAPEYTGASGVAPLFIAVCRFLPCKLARKIFLKSCNLGDWIWFLLVIGGTISPGITPDVLVVTDLIKLALNVQSFWPIDSILEVKLKDPGAKVSGVLESLPNLITVLPTPKTEPGPPA